jgi:hypothetical protein
VHRKRKQHFPEFPLCPGKFVIGKVDYDYLLPVVGLMAMDEGDGGYARSCSFFIKPISNPRKPGVVHQANLKYQLFVPIVGPLNSDYYDHLLIRLVVLR